MKRLFMIAMFFVCLFGTTVSADDADTTVTFFNETFGTPTSNTDVTAYSGWSEMGVSYSGSAKVGVTSSYICTIDGSSKSGYLYCNNKSNTTFYIDSLNTEDYDNVYLTFNLKKSASANTYTVSYSTDSLNGSFTKLSITSSTTTNWKSITVKDTLPSTSYLCLEIEHTTTNSGSGSTKYIYIDDLQLYGTPKEQTEEEKTEEEDEDDVEEEDEEEENDEDEEEEGEEDADTNTAVTLSFDEDSYSISEGDTLTLTATSNYTVDITYSSSDTTIATIDAITGLVTAMDTGTVTITATTTDTDGNAVTDTCTLTVDEATSYKKGEYAIVGYESGKCYAMCNTDEFDKGDRLDATSVYMLNSKVIYTDTINSTIKWTVDEENGTIMSSDGQYAAYLEEEDYPVYIGLKNKAYSWYCNGEDGYFYTSEEQKRALGVNYISTAGFVFGAYTSSSSSSFAVAMPFAHGYHRSVTSGNYGTICLRYAVAADDMNGAEFYSPLGKVVENGTVTGIVLEQVDELESGIPYVFLATGNTLLAAYSGEEATTAGTNNGLIGTFSEIDNIAEGMYMIKDSVLKKVGSASGGLYAYRAYFNLDSMSVYSESEISGANIRVLSLAEVEEEETSEEEEEDEEIEEDVEEEDDVEDKEEENVDREEDDDADEEENVEDVIEDEEDPTGITSATTRIENNILTDVYNLCGMKIRSQVPLSEATAGLGKGIYIINGKKRVIK